MAARNPPFAGEAENHSAGTHLRVVGSYPTGCKDEAGKLMPLGCFCSSEAFSFVTIIARVKAQGKLGLEHG